MTPGLRKSDMVMPRQPSPEGSLVQDLAFLDLSKELALLARMPDFNEGDRVIISMTLCLKSCGLSSRGM